MNDKSNVLLTLQIVVLIGSLAATSLFVRKALNFHGRLWLALLVFFVCTAGFTYLSVVLPLFFFVESEQIQHNLSVDLMMYGALGLMLIGIIGFAIDHMYERPTWLVVSAAAVLSIGISPLFYRYQQDKLNESFKVKIVSSEPPAQTIPPPK